MGSRNRLLSLSLVVLSSISGITEFINVATSCSNPHLNNTMTAISIIAVACVAVLSLVQNSYKFEKVATQHQIAASRYENLKRDIDEALVAAASSSSESSSLGVIMRRAKKELKGLSPVYLTIPEHILARAGPQFVLVQNPNNDNAEKKETEDPHKKEGGKEDKKEDSFIDRVGARADLAAQYELERADS